MNQKCLIALIVVFFFLVHVEKIYGCHPSGQGCRGNGCGAKIIDANLLPNKNLNITIVVSRDNPPKFVNGHYCNKNYVGAIYDPYTSSWEYGFTTPPKGTWFDVWVAVYWTELLYEYQV
ncbi:unnamed protein product [Rhizophagus irregularis]|uniref:Uncharacterized protein n=1 Tax=Rhizophagus irregularis TaxID=588596 RepID=A0A2N1MJX2_9GLOM|nr:hypothetical protein RhiirC2_791156 [Rhizophagus irregularis]CAB5366155.1 unnamed protein product [Rhizophagus irregularis]